MKYILLTAAYNEEKYIRKTIESVLSQSILPSQWLIISDQSGDHTDEIIKEYASVHPFITYIRHSKSEVPSSKLGKVSKRVVACIQKGLKHLSVQDYDYLGVIDADITFEKNLFKQLLEYFGSDHKLGLGGGYIYNFADGKKTPYFTKPELVGGALQLFRRKCWEQIGGYFPGGHHDYYAVASCKMMGWKVHSFQNLEILHLKNTLTVKKNPLKTAFYLGQMDYVCGELFLYSFIRAISLMKQRPYCCNSIMRIAGFLCSSLKNTPKQVPPALEKFIHKQQLEKISQIFKKRKRTN